jgi:hypothetical protein
VCKQVTVCPGHIWTTLYLSLCEYRRLKVGEMSTIMCNSHNFKLSTVRVQLFHFCIRRCVKGAVCLECASDSAITFSHVLDYKADIGPRNTPHFLMYPSMAVFICHACITCEQYPIFDAMCLSTKIINWLNKFHKYLLRATRRTVFNVGFQVRCALKIIVLAYRTPWILPSFM